MVLVDGVMHDRPFALPFARKGFFSCNGDMMIPTSNKACKMPLACLLLVMGACLSGCASVGALVNGSDGGKTARPAAMAAPAQNMPLGPYSFVQRVPSETGAVANQGRALDQEALRLALAALQTSAGSAVFSPQQLDQLSLPLSVALAASAAGEDVTFAVAAEPDGLRLMSTYRVSSGRAFVRDGALQLLLGLVQSPFDLERVSRQPTKVFFTGSRLRPSPDVPALKGDGWRRVQPARGDWLEVPLESLRVRTAPPLPASLPSAQQAPARVMDDIERRMATLARLRQQDLISEDEYQEKRRLILNAL